MSEERPRVRVVPYDERWPEAFGQERDQLASVLGQAALAMVDSLTPGLEVVGYVAKGEYGIAGRRYFTRSAAAGLKVHVHVYGAGDPQIGRHLRFRDYLRSHSASAVRYGALKRGLALAHGDDADAYQSGKAAFIDGVDALAATHT